MSLVTMGRTITTDKTDRTLFFASTLINVGNGKNTPFWKARWLNGVSPAELAPSLYQQARYKTRTVHKELHHFNWIKNLKAIDSENLMDEFILLFSKLSDRQFIEQEDAICWKWTATGEYMAASAYEAQFLGSYPRFRASTIWQAHAKPKCRFFAWLALLGKAPTADNLLKKNWPCDPNCSLCYCLSETSKHLLTECNFTEAVWDRVTSMVQIHDKIKPFQKGNIMQWVQTLLSAGPKHQQRHNAGVVLFFWWGI